MKKKVAILGSTGSIGKQALEVLAAHPDRFEATALIAHSNGGLLIEQRERFGSRLVGLINGKAEDEKRGILVGEQCLEAAVSCGVDLVLIATRGITALRAALKAIEIGLDIALANKESLVCGGALIKEALSKSKSLLLPVDSEHSAVWQCLGKGEVESIILTASGGPFYRMTTEEMKSVTPELALRHPNWNMGSKITIDSATMMNKGLEVIEAHWLFGLPMNKIRVLVHPRSIVHSMVEYKDGTILAQMARPDMKFAIQYAFSYPERLCCDAGSLDLATAGPLEFFELDEDRFPAVALAREAFETNSFMPVVLNAANDVAVNAFLEKRAAFSDILITVGKTVGYYKNRLNGIQLNVDAVFDLDREAKTVAEQFLKGN